MSRKLFVALGLAILVLAWSPAGLLAAEPANGHAAEPEPNILELKPSLAFATLIIFLTLLAVLWKFAWGPLSKALQQREQNQEKMLREAEHARLESERLLAEHRSQMEQAAEQVRGMLDQARRDAEAMSANIQQKAQAEAEATRDQARREIETARDQALIDIYSKTADLAVSVAGKVLSRELSPDDRRRLVEVAANELPASPAGTNGHGGHHG